MMTDFYIHIHLLSSIYNIAISSEKVTFSELRKEYTSTTLNKQSERVLNNYVSGFRCERTTGVGLFHWRKCYYGQVFQPEVTVQS